MRFWIAGAHGQLGSAVCAALTARSIEYIGTDHELDIGDRSAVEKFATAQPFTHVINCAAYTQVDRCETDEAAAARINTDGPMHIGRAAAQHAAVAIQISTDYVFDGTARIPYVETDATGPINAYGRTKLGGEQRFLAETAKLPAYVVRTSWLFGPKGPNFVQTMLRLMSERPEVRVVDDQTGRPTYAPDLAETLVELSLRTPERGIYHFANTGQVTWYGLAAATRTEALARGKSIDAVLTRIASAEYPTPAQRPAWSVLATDKIEHTLEIEPRPWRDALKSYFEAIG